MVQASSSLPPVEVVPSKRQHMATPATESDGGHTKLLPSKPKSFRVVGLFVKAMKRFEATINPTYTYGKEEPSTDGVQVPAAVIAQAGMRSTNPGGRTSSGRTLSGRDIGPPGKQHGHKGQLLFKPLPQPVEEAAH